MKLIRAEGHQQQQWALVNPHTQTIARILSEHIDDDYILVSTVADILQNLHGEMHENLAEELANMRRLYRATDFTEEAVIPDYVAEIIQAIHELYYQPRSVLYPNMRDQINSLRGAVVERLGLELIRHRYQATDECANSRRFVDQHNKIVTLQEIDIATLSHNRHELEAYECKIKALSLENHDCLDLAYLHQVAETEDYQAQVGVISLDPSRAVEKRLRWLHADPCIQAYGVETLNELEYSPFE
jgi:hypothetical protein